MTDDPERWRRWISPEERTKQLTRGLVWSIGIVLLLFGLGYLLKSLGVIR